MNSMENKEMITVKVNGIIKTAGLGDTLSEIANGEKPCGGHGKCGKCKVIAKGKVSKPTATELELLSAEEIANNVRIGCLARAVGDCEIETAVGAEDIRIMTDGALPSITLRPSFAKYGVAIDIGTTTLAARLYNTNGSLLASASELNPQSEWGADVISRIEAALGGQSKEIAMSIRRALNDLLSDLATLASIDAKEIDGVCITGNTVMLSLLTEQSTEPFSHAPFKAERLFGESVTAKALALSDLTDDVPLYIAPCISAFVGADTVCAIVSTRLCDGECEMLADIGTNGEIAMWNRGRLTVCSTAAGPAFEGVGISMGMRGSDGAIDSVSIENGKLVAHVIGETEPRGICGSGLIDAVACMLDVEIIDEGGYLEDEPFTLKAPVYLTQSDIRMLQMAKSAICAGLMTLIAHEGLEQSDIRALYIAGGFGYHISRENAARIGLLPHKLASVGQAVGNAALTGASILLLDTDMRERAEIIAKSANVIDLTINPTFSNKYMSGMMLEQV